MRLADFIVRDMEAILKEWETFAASLLPTARGMTKAALRDHAGAILKAIAPLSRRTLRSKNQKVERLY